MINDESTEFHHSVPLSYFLKAVSKCSNWTISLGVAFIIVSQVFFEDNLASTTDDVSSVVSLGLFSAGLFNVGTGLGIKAVTYYAEEAAQPNQEILVV